MTTSIEWTQETWNPVRGCKPISPGCANCYAMRFAHRFSAPGQPYEGLTRLRTKGGPVWTGEARFVEEMLAEPLRWRTPRRVFVNSMSDLFHEDVSFEEIAAVFGVMAMCPQHTFQVLTKRPDRMVQWFAWVQEQHERGEDPWTPLLRETLSVLGEPWLDRIVEDGRARDPERDEPWPLPNVWLGVSVEDQRHADERIPHLLRVPAKVRFLSCEPLLELVDLAGDLGGSDYLGDAYDAAEDGISWVIVGGESGYGSRPFDLAWARWTRDQCRAAKVPFFFKQAGAKPLLDGAPLALRDRKGGDLAEIPEDLRIREWP